MTLFRPCIDLHRGRVKQIVGGTLRDDGEGLATRFESQEGAEHYAALYRRDGLRGGHVIQLGPGNEAAARRALAAYPGGLQVGGGIDETNAAEWLEAGASHVIATSRLFDAEAHFRPERLAALRRAAGAERLVVDLSCRATADGWRVAMDRWQRLTDLAVDAGTLRELAGSCAEFLVHAADVEGRMSGVDEALVRYLGAHSPVVATYAGGARGFGDLERVETLSHGRVDLTIGSALDIFGGAGARYADCVAWNRGR